MTFKVGDEVILVSHRYYRAEPRITRETVARVGRKYCYLDAGKVWWLEKMPFHLEDGVEHRNDGYSATARIYTPEAWEAKERREKVLRNLKLHGVSFGLAANPKWSTEVLERIDAILDAALAAKAS